jgi:hypothetical protein
MTPNDTTSTNGNKASERGSVNRGAATLFALTLSALTLLTIACQTPHTPTRVLPRIDPASGYVYDELLSAQGLTFDEQGKIQAVTPAWAKAALGRVLDLQQALDECQAERRHLLP